MSIRKAAVLYSGVAGFIPTAALAPEAEGQVRQLPNECRTKTGQAQRRILRPIRSVALEDSDTAPIASISSMALGAHGLIAILDRRDYNVKLFHPTGRLLRLVGRRGQGPGELAGPTAVGLVGDSLVVVADERRARLIVYDTAGSLRAERALAARPIGGLVVNGTTVVIGGLNGFRERPPTAHLALAVDLATAGDPRIVGLLPESYSRHPPILASPVFLAPAGGRGGEGAMYASWRLSNEVVRLTREGEVGPAAALPNSRGFVDPRRLLSEGSPKTAQEIADLTSPILSLFASDGLVYVGYVSPGAGSKPLKFHVLDGELQVLATNVTGLGVVATIADTVITGRGDEDFEGHIHHQMTWNVRCRRPTR